MQADKVKGPARLDGLRLGITLFMPFFERIRDHRIRDQYTGPCTGWSWFAVNTCKSSTCKQGTAEIAPPSRIFDTILGDAGHRLRHQDQ